MKALKLSVLVILSVFLLVSCGKDKKTSDSKEETKKEVKKEFVEEDLETSDVSKNDIDELLDEYEEFVDEYLPVCKKVAEGDLSYYDRLAEMVEEASELENVLLSVESEMTPKQARRYTKITEKVLEFAEEMSHTTHEINGYVDEEYAEEEVYVDVEDALEALEESDDWGW